MDDTEIQHQRHRARRIRKGRRRLCKVKRLPISQLAAEAAMSERTGREIMTFSPIVHRAVSGAAGVAAGNNGSVVQSFRPHSARVASSGNKENEGDSAAQSSATTSLMRAPKAAELILLNMKKEVDGVRSFLRDVSAGRAGNDGPYFEPCRAKGAAEEEKSIKNHPIYRANVSEDEEYELLLSSQAKKTRQEPAKEAALQRTINLKLRQATQELLNKRNALAEKLCRLDDNFVEKEKSYKMQMHTFTQQIKKEQACRVRAEGQVESAKSQVETYKSLAETQTANLQAIALERDDILVRLQQLQEEAGEQLDLQAAGFQTQISEMKAEMQAQIDIKDRELQEKDALAASESEALVASESDTRRQLLELEVKYREDVELLRMQMDEMGEAREHAILNTISMPKEVMKRAEKQEEMQRTEVQLKELHARGEELAAEAAAHQASIADLQTEVERKAGLLQDEESSRACLESRLQDMAAHLQEAQREKTQLSDKLSDVLALLQEKESELAGRIEELQEKENELAEMAGQLEDRDTAAKETDLRQQSISEELQALRRTASTELQLKTAEIAAQAQTIDELEAAVQQQAALVQESAAALASATAEGAEALARKSTELDAAAGSLVEVAAELRLAETALAEKGVVFEQLEAQQQQLQAELQDTQHTLARTSAAKDELEAENAQLLSQIQMLGSSSDEQLQSLVSEQQQHAAAQAALQRIEVALQDEQQQHAAAQAALQRIEVALQDEQQQHAAAQASLQRIEVALQDEKQQHADTQAALQRMEVLLQDEKSQHAAAGKRGSELEDALAVSAAALDSMRTQAAAAHDGHAAEFADLTSQIQRLKDEAALLQERHAATIAELQEQLRAKKDASRELMTELQRDKDASKELMAEVQRRQEREDRLLQDVEREATINKALQAKADALEEKAGDMRTKLAVAQAQLAATEDDVRRRQEREDKREAEAGVLKAQLLELTHARDTMLAEQQRRDAQVAAESERASLERRELQTSLAAAASAAESLKELLGGTETELKASRDTLASKVAMLQEKEADVSALEERMRQQQLLRETADREGRAALEALTSECERERAAHTALESEKKQLMWKQEAQEEKVADLRTQLAAAQQQLEEGRRALGKREGEKEEARMEVARLKAERDMQDIKVREMQAKLDAKEEQIKDAIKTVQQVQDVSLERSKEVAKERENLTLDMHRSKDQLVQAHRELDTLKKHLADLESKSKGAEDVQSKQSVELETLRADVGALVAKLERVSKEKSAAAEKLAVLQAEYNTYKAVCNTPTKLADQLSKLVSLEADRASVQSRLFEATEDAECSKALVASLKEEVKSLKHKLFRAENTRRKLHNELQELKGNVRVFARVRPADERCVLAVDDDSSALMLPYNGVSHVFHVDRAFNARASQEDVFGEVSQFVQSALDGYNVSLFAYGQTGSGKTHTMFGTGNDVGIIPRSIAQILEAVEEAKENSWEYALEASFLEIYQEQVFDLLCPESEREGLRYTIVQGEHGRHDVTDLQWRRVGSKHDVEEMLEASQRNKHVARTDMNERSSRSHTVFTLRISGMRSAVGGQVQTMHGTLHLVDLAGSERLAKSNATGERLKETQAINKSLSALSDVFVAISKHQSHVPYRNSKLTFLLQPCLSGDGKALLIANCSPVEPSSHETLCTLRFASMVSSCELGKATRNISSDKTLKSHNTSLASSSQHLSMVHCNDSMASVADPDLSFASLDSSLSSSIFEACTNTSATAPRGIGAAATRRALADSSRIPSARGIGAGADPNDSGVRSSSRRAPNAASSVSSMSMGPPAPSSRLIRGTAASKKGAE